MKIFRIVIIVALLVAVVFGVKRIFLSPANPSMGPASQKGAKGQPVAVSGILAKPMNLEEEFFVTGSIAASEEVLLQPEVSGKIMRLPFTEGSRVKKGDLLCKLNDAELQAQLKKQAEQEKLAVQKEKRLKELKAIGAVTQEEYDLALNSLQLIQADKEILAAQIERTEIHAPFSGQIGLRYLSVGSMVSQADKIALLEQTDPVRLDFSVPEKYAAEIFKTQTVSFFVEGWEEKFTATVYAIEPKVDLETRTLTIRATCPNPAGKLIPGAFARVTVQLKAKENSILIPSQALVPVMKGNKIFIARNGTAEEAMVITGLRTDSRVQILKGVTAGDTVITSGVMMLRQGAPLIVTKMEGDSL